jgi:hypothetical protein
VAEEDWVGVICCLCAHVIEAIPFVRTPVAVEVLDKVVLHLLRPGSHEVTRQDLLVTGQDLRPSS